jgi:hypothetical protein
MLLEGKYRMDVVSRRDSNLRCSGALLGIEHLHKLISTKSTLTGTIQHIVTRALLRGH